MAKRRSRTRRRAAGAIGTGTVIVLGLGAAAAGIAYYEYKKNHPTPPATQLNPAPVTPSATGVTVATSPVR